MKKLKREWKEIKVGRQEGKEKELAERKEEVIRDGDEEKDRK